jgi:hypothetical protein
MASGAPFFSEPVDKSFLKGDYKKPGAESQGASWDFYESGGGGVFPQKAEKQLRIG